MASFTDTNLVPYNAYTPSIDTELYGKVIMQKQQQYDAGVEKINSTISNIAGLDIIRDSDKAYLQEKLTALQSSLSGIAGADFSQVAKVNQAIGLAMPIAKDRRIQSAVSSTANYKKGLSDMQSAIKEGKSDPANEWIFKESFERYLKGGEEDTFNGQYVPHKEYKKKAVEALKALTGDKSTTDLTLDDAILRVKMSGISPQKIKAAMMAVMDPGDLQQMTIDGRYTYSNKTPDEFAKLVADNHSGNIKALADKKKDIKAKADALASGAEKDRLKEQVDNIDLEIKSIVKDNDEYQEIIKGGNVESAKANFYSSNFLRTFSTAFSHTETSQTYETNPMAQIQLERAKMAQSHAHWQADFDQREQLAQMKLEGKGTVVTNGVGDGVPKQTFGEAELNNEITLTEQQLRNYDRDFLSKQSTETDRKDEAWLSKQEQLYRSGKKLEPSMKEFFDVRTAMETKLLTKQQLMSQIAQDADREVGQIEFELPKDAKPLTFKYKNSSYTFSPQELAEFAYEVKNARHINRNAPISTAFAEITGTPSYGQREWLDKLTDKQKVLAEVLQRTRSGDSPLPIGGKLDMIPLVGPMIKEAYESNTASEMDKQINKELDKYRDVTNKAVYKQYEKRHEYIQNEIAKRTGVNEAVNYKLPAGEAKEKADRRSDVQRLIDTKKVENRDEVSKIIDDDDAVYTLKHGKTIDGTPTFKLIVSKGTDSEAIDLSLEDKRGLYGTAFESNLESQFDAIQTRLNSTKNGTTNFSGTKDPIKASVNPMFTRNNFSNVENFSISGDVVEQNGRYALDLYVYNPYSKPPEMRRVQYAPPTGLMDRSALLKSIPSMDDAKIFELLTNKKMTQEDLTNLKKLNEKAD